MINLHNSYFSITNPLVIIDRWRNPYSHKSDIQYMGKKLHVCWTSRAEYALQKRAIPLTVEMQIYFSCVIQKRVLFHDQSKLETQTVNNSLRVTLRAVQAASCDPIEFAEHHPVSHEFTSIAAKKLRPSELQIDFKKDQWIGNFMI